MAGRVGGYDAVLCVCLCCYFGSMQVYKYIENCFLYYMVIAFLVNFSEG